MTGHGRPDDAARATRGGATTGSAAPAADHRSRHRHDGGVRATSSRISRTWCGASTSTTTSLDDGTAAAFYLALTLGRPLLLEGEPGVGKTAAAKALAAVLDVAADPAAVLRGPDRGRGALRLELPAPAAGHPAGRGRGTAASSEADLFTEEFLIERPILRCVRHRGPAPPVLLIDEIDRADDEFEALLLEFLGEAAVTVPELGTFTAERPPVVGADLQPQPRPARRAAAALPLPLDRLSRSPARAAADPASHRAGRNRPR